MTTASVQSLLADRLTAILQVVDETSLTPMQRLAKITELATEALEMHHAPTPEQEPLSARDYQTALDVQSACNLSGIVYSFAKLMPKICADAFGTDARNHHPICVMFAEQIYHLTGGSDSYSEAYNACTEKSAT